jgi:hypothetical protein
MSALSERAEGFYEEPTPDINYDLETIRALNRQSERLLDPSLLERGIDVTVDNLPIAKVGILSTVAFLGVASRANIARAASATSRSQVELSVPNPSSLPKLISADQEQKLLLIKDTKRLYVQADMSGTKPGSSYEVEPLAKGGSIWQKAEAAETSGKAAKNISQEVKAAINDSGVAKLAKERGISINQAVRSLPDGFKVKLDVKSNTFGDTTQNHKVVSQAEITVYPGDYLSLEAEEHNESLGQLLNANPSYKIDPNYVEAGAKIIVNTGAYETTISKQPVKRTYTTSRKSNPTVAVKSSNPSTPKASNGAGGAGLSSSSPTSAPAKQPEAKPTTPITTAEPTESGPSGVSSGSTTTGPEAPTRDIKPVTKVVTKIARVTVRHDRNDERRAEKEHDRDDRHHHHNHADHTSEHKPHLSHHKHKAQSELKNIHVSKHFCDSTLVGHSIEQKDFNYIVVCEKLDKSEAAGEEGNLGWESRFDPTIVQGGSQSHTPTYSTDIGWGLDQSTPGDKMYQAKSDYHVRGPIWKELTQLNIIRMQMHGTSPTGNWDMLSNMRQTHTPAQAAEVFEQDFEEGPIAASGGGDLEERQELAKEYYGDFHDTSPLHMYKEAVLKAKKEKLRHEERGVKGGTTFKVHVAGHHSHFKEITTATDHNKHHDHKVKFHHKEHHRIQTANFIGWNLTGEHAMVNYNQCNPAWANVPYGNPGQTTLCQAGCGIASYADIDDTLTGSQANPADLGYRYGPEFHTDGTSWSFFPVGASRSGMREQEIGTNLNAAAKVLREGGLVEGSFGVGHFTTEGHFMVIRGESKGGNFYLANPANAGAIAMGRGNTDQTAYNWRYLLNPDEGHLENMWAFEPGSSTHHKRHHRQRRAYVHSISTLPPAAHPPVSSPARTENHKHHHDHDHSKDKSKTSVTRKLHTLPIVKISHRQAGHRVLRHIVAARHVTHNATPAHHHTKSTPSIHIGLGRVEAHKIHPSSPTVRIGVTTLKHVLKTIDSGAAPKKISVQGHHKHK